MTKKRVLILASAAVAACVFALIVLLCFVLSVRNDALPVRGEGDTSGGQYAAGTVAAPAEETDHGTGTAPEEYSADAEISAELEAIRKNLDAYAQRVEERNSGSDEEDPEQDDEVGSEDTEENYYEEDKAYLDSLTDALLALQESVDAEKENTDTQIRDMRENTVDRTYLKSELTAVDASLSDEIGQYRDSEEALRERVSSESESTRSALSSLEKKITEELESNSRTSTEKMDALDAQMASASEENSLFREQISENIEQLGSDLSERTEQFGQNAEKAAEEAARAADCAADSVENSEKILEILTAGTDGSRKCTKTLLLHHHEGSAESGGGCYGTEAVSEDGTVYYLTDCGWEEGEQEGILLMFSNAGPSDPGKTD